MIPRWSAAWRRSTRREAHPHPDGHPHSILIELFVRRGYRHHDPVRRRRQPFDLPRLRDNTKVSLKIYGRFRPWTTARVPLGPGSASTLTSPSGIGLFRGLWNPGGPGPSRRHLTLGHISNPSSTQSPTASGGRPLALSGCRRPSSATRGEANEGLCWRGSTL